MNWLAAFQVAKNLFNRLVYFCGVAVKRAAKIILLQCAVAALLIQKESFAEAGATARPEVIRNHLNVEVVRGRTERGAITALLDEDGSNAVGHRVKLFSPVAPNSLPVSNQKAEQKCESAEGDCGLLGVLFYVLENHGLSMLFWGLFGYICGGGFGWPPFRREESSE